MGRYSRCLYHRPSFYLLEAVVIYSSPLWNNQVIVPCGVGLRLDLSRKRSCYILWSRKLSIDGEFTYTVDGALVCDGGRGR